MGQNVKIGQIWRPVAPQQDVIQKVDWSRKLPGPWTTTWIKQYLSALHPVTCNLLWVRYLFDGFSISGFRGRWSLRWNFRKCLSRFLNGTQNYVSRPNLVKIVRCEVAKRSSGLPQKKNSGSTGLVPAPFLPKMGRSCSKFPERCHPLTCPCVLNLVRIGCAFCRTYSGKIDFLAPKVTISCSCH